MKSIKILIVTFMVTVMFFVTDVFANDAQQETIEPFPEEIETEVVTVEEPEFTEEEIDLLALVTMAEAEGESEHGQRLVIDTILNRVDSEHFPNTVSDVVYQKGQFSSMWDGRVDDCYVMDEIRNLVLEELESRTNGDVMFFRTKKYSKYGSPLFKVGAHYFSSHD